MIEFPSNYSDSENLVSNYILKQLHDIQVECNFLVLEMVIPYKGCNEVKLILSCIGLARIPTICDSCLFNVSAFTRTA